MTADTDREMVIPSLPDEVLGMICQELGLDRDFGCLYRCAQVSRSFADPALRTMYKYANNGSYLPQQLTHGLDTMKCPRVFCKAMNSILAWPRLTLPRNSLMLSKSFDDGPSFGGLS